MQRRLASSILAPISLAILFLAGCDKSNLGSVDPKPQVSFLADFQLSPDSVNIDRLTPTNGNYQVSTTVTVKVSGIEGTGATLASVIASSFRPLASGSFLQTPLRDDGVSPDVAPGDNIFSGIINFETTRSLAGRYRIQIAARTSDGTTSNTLDRSLFVTRNNAKPVLGTLVAPDSVVLPVGGAITVFMSIAVSDSDGVADIREVSFKSLTSSTPDFKFFLKDDGNLDPPGVFGVKSGDAIAGDGIYSVQIPLVDGLAQRRTNQFLFQAVDTFGDTSLSRTHFLKVK